MNLRLAFTLALAAVGFAGAAASASPTAPDVLYINRCVGGCTLSGGADDAKAHTSSVVNGTNVVLKEFNHAGQGVTNDQMWDMVYQCVKEVYSPYNIQITDQRPADNVLYNEADVGGSDTDIGQTGLLGVATQEPCMDPVHNVIAFTFANDVPFEQNAQVTAWSICGIIAQETGHAYGLDHEFKYKDTGKPACNSPMTYLHICGEQFFRGELALCGESGVRACKCSDPQNSHLRLTGVLGTNPDGPITAPPDVTFLAPAAGASVQNGAMVQVRASAQRGVNKVELIVNGYNWESAAVDGAPFGSTGQPETTYTMMLPADLPDGTLDIQVKVSDDIGVSKTTDPVRVQKGNKCADAATDCAAGQNCDGDGRCFWDPASGNLGDKCTYAQFCTSGICTGFAGDSNQFCTQSCVLGSQDSCPMGYECIAASDSQGYCFVAGAGGGGGCCAIGGGAAAQSVLFGAALVFVVGRRKRRPAR